MAETLTGRTKAGNVDMQSANITGTMLNVDVEGSTASLKIVNIVYDASATSGDSRAAYIRLNVTGIGGGGEALRAFCEVVDVVADTVRGAHISLSMNASGTVTGLGSALTTTLHIPSTAGQTGTICSINCEIYSDATTSDPTGATSIAFIRVVNSGDTGKTTIDDDAVLFDFAGFTEASGKMLYDNTGTDPTNTDGSIKIRLPDGALAYIMYHNQQAA